MKRLLSAVLGIGLVSLSGVAWADCPSGYGLQRIGSVQTDDAAISTQGQDVHLIVADCSGTACTAGLYDGDTLPEATNANLIIDIGGAANTTAIMDLTDSPITFASGITFVDDANVDAVALFSCQPRR